VLDVNGYVLLMPLMAVGGWRRRRHPLVRAASAYALVLFLSMTVVFPFAGARGGYFHSSAALMPLLWALAAIGIDMAAVRLAPLRSWEAGGARALLVTAALFLAASLSVWALAGKAGLFGPASAFDRNQQVYRQAGERIGTPNAEAVAAVNDPPGFFLATGMPSVVIPDGPEESLRQLAARYGVDWIVLEADHPADLEGLYRNPTGRPWLGPPQRFLDPAGQPVLVFEVTLDASDGG
jgi:hypothetical protein